MVGFAVVDLETSGFSAWDKVIEVGVVLLDETLTVEREWSSLVYSRRVGASDKHGIIKEDLEDAPLFEEIAQELAELLQGRVLVAHNISFDERMLRQEFQRLGFFGGDGDDDDFEDDAFEDDDFDENPDSKFVGWCTMKVGRQRFNCSGKLADCLAAAGLSNPNAHHALADARATAQLLQFYGKDRKARRMLEETPVQPMDLGEVLAARLRRAPAYPRGSAPIGQRGWVDRLAGQVGGGIDPEPGESRRVDKYRNKLTEALMDGRISRAEVRTLTEKAQELGMSAADVDVVHRQYFLQMAHLAWADGVLDEDERAALTTVAEQLEVDPGLANAVLSGPVNLAVLAQQGHFRLHPGDRVTFVGRLRKKTALWGCDLKAYGFEAGSLTKKTVFVVAANPDAEVMVLANARQRGLPIILEDDLETILAAHEQQPAQPAAVAQSKDAVGKPAESSTPENKPAENEHADAAGSEQELATPVVGAADATGSQAPEAAPAPQPVQWAAAARSAGAATGDPRPVQWAAAEPKPVQWADAAAAAAAPGAASFAAAEEPTAAESQEPASSASASVSQPLPAATDSGAPTASTQAFDASGWGAAPAAAAPSTPSESGSTLPVAPTPSQPAAPATGAIPAQPTAPAAPAAPFAPVTNNPTEKPEPTATAAAFTPAPAEEPNIFIQRAAMIHGVTPEEFMATVGKGNTMPPLKVYTEEEAEALDVVGSDEFWAQILIPDGTPRLNPFGRASLRGQLSKYRPGNLRTPRLDYITQGQAQRARAALGINQPPLPTSAAAWWIFIAVSIIVSILLIPAYLAGLVLLMTMLIATIHHYVTRAKLKPPFAQQPPVGGYRP